jgi:uncharacterized SAM-binding protein YcdF (DUF218 family)
MGPPVRILLVVVGLLLYLSAAALLCTTRGGAVLLVRLLEWQSSPVSPDILKDKVQAIALLGGRTARVHYAARLQAETGLPLLITGKGTGDSPFAAESEKMQDILQKKYGIRAEWVETEALTTRQNALFSWCLLEQTGVRRLALVTDPQHMPRARAHFEAAGFDIVPAPTPDGARTLESLTLASFVPGRQGIAAAKYPLEQWGGVLLARLESLLPARPDCDGKVPVH